MTTLSASMISNLGSGHLTFILNICRTTAQIYSDIGVLLHLYSECQHVPRVEDSFVHFDLDHAIGD